MDYFSIIILIIVVFIFISDRKLKSIKEIQKVNKNIKKQIKQIENNLDIIELDMSNIICEEIKKIATNSEKEYIILKHKELNLKEQDVKQIIANYIDTNQSIMGFNAKYVYESKKINIKSLYVNIINYLNIFNKNNLTTYVIFLIKKSDIKKYNFSEEMKIVSFLPSNITNIIIEEDISKENLKNICIDKISKGRFCVIFKISLLLFCGSLITTNLVSSILNISQNLNQFIISVTIYMCYSYIIRYIHKSIGKHKMIASYIFPVYFVSYIIVIIISGIKNKKSTGIIKYSGDKMKKLVICIIILLVVFVLFILLKERFKNNSDKICNYSYIQSILIKK